MPLINRFLQRLPTWGGKINIASSTNITFNNFSLINTCNFDYLLFCLWLTSEINNEQPKISRSEYADIINSIDKVNIFVI